MFSGIWSLFWRLMVISIDLPPDILRAWTYSIPMDRSGMLWLSRRAGPAWIFLPGFPDRQCSILDALCICDMPSSRICGPPVLRARPISKSWPLRPLNTSEHRGHGGPTQHLCNLALHSIEPLVQLTSNRSTSTYLIKPWQEKGSSESLPVGLRGKPRTPCPVRNVTHWSPFWLWYRDYWASVLRMHDNAVQLR